MILEALLDLCVTIIHWIFVLLPDIPSFNVVLLEDLTGFINLIFDNLDLLGFFIDIQMVKTLVPLVILVINFEHVYDLAMWTFSKIPYLNVKR